MIVGGAATVVGLVQYMSLPPETGPRWSWWVPPVIATVCGAALPFVPRSAPWLRAAFVLVAGAQLLLWGWARRSGLVKPVLPTSAPFWLDRLVERSAVWRRESGWSSLAVVELARDVGRALHNRNRQCDRIHARELERDVECLAGGERLDEIRPASRACRRRERHRVPGSARHPSVISCIPIAPVAVVTDSCISA